MATYKAFDLLTSPETVSPHPWKWKHSGFLDIPVHKEFPSPSFYDATPVVPGYMLNGPSSGDGLGVIGSGITDAAQHIAVRPDLFYIAGKQSFVMPDGYICQAVPSSSPVTVSTLLIDRQYPLLVASFAADTTGNIIIKHDIHQWTGDELQPAINYKRTTPVDSNHETFIITGHTDYTGETFYFCYMPTVNPLSYASLSYVTDKESAFFLTVNTKL